MPKIFKEFNQSSGATGLYFYCPGCKGPHAVNTDPNHLWQFNDDVDKPTLTPSVLVSGRDFTVKGQADYDAWYASGCPKNEDGSLHQFESAPTVCHSFITDGHIQFLSDCTHDLAGQTVEVPEFKWDEED